MAARGIVSLCVSLWLSVTSGLEVGCRNPKGEIVDWFAIYKLPELEDSSNPLISQGMGHMYLDVNNQQFTLSDVSLNATGQAFAQTLDMLSTSSSNDIAYVLYNDEPPDGKKSVKYGHTKGVVAYGETSGFWLVHSVPKFPGAVKDSYYWPCNAMRYGQSALCITMSSKQMEVVANQLKFNYPWVYDHNLPSDLLSLAPTFQDVVKGTHVTSPPWSHSVSLTSMEGQNFISFAKFVNFEEDLYDAWVAPTLKSSLWTETWQNGASKLPSNCSTGTSYNVYNNKNIAFTDEIEFHETKDHSKWAVTGEGVQVICIGDINRMSSQFKRGGGTVCASLPNVWDQYKSTISDYNKC